MGSEGWAVKDESRAASCLTMLFPAGVSQGLSGVGISQHTGILCLQQVTALLIGGDKGFGALIALQHDQLGPEPSANDHRMTALPGMHRQGDTTGIGHRSQQAQSAGFDPWHVGQQHCRRAGG